MAQNAQNSCCSDGWGHIGAPLPHPLLLFTHFLHWEGLVRHTHTFSPPTLLSQQAALSTLFNSPPYIYRPHFPTDHSDTFLQAAQWWNHQISLKTWVSVSKICIRAKMSFGGGLQRFSTILQFEANWNICNHHARSTLENVWAQKAHWHRRLHNLRQIWSRRKCSQG